MKKKLFLIISTIAVICLLATVCLVPSTLAGDTVCSKCGAILHDDGKGGSAEGEQSELAKSFGLTICMNCWMDVLYGSSRSVSVPAVTTLVNGKVPTIQLGGEGADNTKFLRGDQTWVAGTGGASWGGITGTLAAQTDLQGVLDSKLSSFTELDPDFGGSVAHGISSGDITNWNGKLSSFTELDPLWSNSASYGITALDITNWNNKLSSYTETDPVVKGLTGIIVSNGATISAITNNSTDWNTAFGWGNHASANYLTGVIADSPLSGAGTSASHLVVDLSSKQTAHANLTSLAGLTWASGSPLIKMTSANTFGLDSTAYLTGNQSISLSGDASGSGTTSISVTNAGLKGVALPTLATGYLYYSGSAWAFQTPAGGSNPSWYGKFYAARGDCDPVVQTLHENMLAVAAPTPTNITASLARCVQFTPPTAITVTNIRLFGVGATTSLYKFAIYPVGSSTTKVWDSGTITTVANAWNNITAGLPITLTAGTKYWWCVTVVSTGTVAGFRSESAPLGTNYYGANVAPLGGTSLGLPVYAQFAVSTGVFPATLPAIAAAAYSAGTTGTVPFGYLDYGGAK